jgi:hypothetical protein
MSPRPGRRLFDRRLVVNEFLRTIGLIFKAAGKGVSDAVYGAVHLLGSVPGARRKAPKKKSTSSDSSKKPKGRTKKKLLRLARDAAGRFVKR